MKKVALDTETRLIQYPDQVNPDLVCVTWYSEGQYIIRHHKNECLEQELVEIFNNDVIIGQNISFDLHVLIKKFPSLLSLVFKALKEKRIKDTMLREKLINLATNGDVGIKNSLDALVSKYLAEDISATKEEGTWRTNYALLYDTPINDWPDEAVQYALKDAEYTKRVYDAQEHLHGKMIKLEHVQVASAFVLRGAEISGIRVDIDRVKALEEDLTKVYNEQVPILKEAGIIRETGTQDKKRLQVLAGEWGVTTQTKTGATSTSKKILGQIHTEDPIYKAYTTLSSIQKMLTTFIPQLSFPRIHPKYNPLINTLRTSCMSSNYYQYQGEQAKCPGKKTRAAPTPSVNLQQIPRDNRVRNCLIPEEGCVFLCADYANLELLCAAQTYYEFFGFSNMRDVLNSGQNLHTFLGRYIYNDLFNKNLTEQEYAELLKSGDKEAKKARQSAKPINLGIPGGQSAETIKRTATETYGMQISIEQATKWRELGRDSYPEIAKFFDSVLPLMKVGKRRIKDDDEEYRLVDAYMIAPMGVPRNNCTYTSAANGLCMQARGAIGKKLALFKIYEMCHTSTSALYGGTLHIDMHDEIVVSIPKEKTVKAEEEMAMIMCSEMQKVLPDMRVAVESMILTRWSKDAEKDSPSKEFHIDCKSKTVV